MTVNAGQQAGGNTRVWGLASTHGGTTVRIESSDPTRVLLSPNTTTPAAAFIDVPVANGSTDANFIVQGVAGTSGTVIVTASAPGFTNATGSVTVK